MTIPQSAFYPPVFVALLAAPASASEPVTVRGHVGQLNVAAGLLTLEPVVGRSVVLTVTAGSRLEIRGETTPLVKFDKGHWVRATYVADDEVNEIVLLKAAVVSDEELGRKLEQVRAATEGSAFQQKGQYEAALRELLDDLGDRLAHLRVEAKGAGSVDRGRILARISAIRYQRATLAETLSKVAKATAGAWGDITTEVGAAVADLRRVLGVSYRD